jgi:hypothetical protein
MIKLRTIRAAEQVERMEEMGNTYRNCLELKISSGSYVETGSHRCKSNIDPVPYAMKTYADWRYSPMYS